MNPQRTTSILKLEPNVPTELALENPAGLEIQGNYGPQVLFNLTNRRRLYVPLEVGKEIRSLSLAPGQPFIIAKVQRQGARGFDWIVERKASSIQTTATAIAPTPYPAIQSFTQIEQALKTAVAAACAAEMFATEIGYTVRFSEESIRCMANTALIAMQRAA